MLLHTARRGASLGEGKTLAVETNGPARRTRTDILTSFQACALPLSYRRNQKRKSPSLQALGFFLRFFRACQERPKALVTQRAFKRTIRIVESNVNALKTNVNPL